MKEDYKGQNLRGNSKDLGNKKEQKEKPDIDIRDIIDTIFGKEGQWFIWKFEDFQKECFKIFDEIDNNTKITDKDKSQAKKKIIEEKLKLAIDEIEIKGIDDSKKKEIKDDIKKRLAGNCQKIIKFLVRKNEIIEKETKIEEKNRRLDQSEEDIESKIREFIRIKGERAANFANFISEIKQNIEDIYNKYNYNKEIIGGKWKRKIEKEIEGEIKKIIKHKEEEINFYSRLANFGNYNITDYEVLVNHTRIINLIKQIEENIRK